jgi:toxin ParE1/3/4
MIFSIKLSTSAEVDFLEALKFYEKISDKLKTDFSLSLDKKMLEISANPKIFRNRYKNVRIAFLIGFTFGIHFIIEKEFIYVLRILHTSRFFK